MCESRELFVTTTTTTSFKIMNTAAATRALQHLYSHLKPFLLMSSIPTFKFIIAHGPKLMALATSLGQTLPAQRSFTMRSLTGFDVLTIDVIGIPSCLRGGFLSFRIPGTCLEISVSDEDVPALIPFLKMGASTLDLVNLPQLLYPSLNCLRPTN